MAVELLVMRNLQFFGRFRPVAFAFAIACVLSAIPRTAWCDDVTAPATAAPANASAPAPTTSPASNTPDVSSSNESESDLVVETPWDFWPYRVSVWIASDDLRVTADHLAQPLTDYLDRDFAAIWRLSISDAPLSVRAAARRGLDQVTYDSITSADPVIALKRNHVDAPRIRFIADVATYVKKCYGTKGRIAEVIQRGKAAGNEGFSGAAKLFEAVEGDSLAVIEKWSDPAVEAIITNRGMAKGLKEPPAKIIPLPIDNLVAETIEASDKLFIVHVETTRLPWTISVIELDCLMRNFSVVHQRTIASPKLLVSVMGQAITEVFAPLIRIEDAGAKNAKGLVRAHGLITAEKSPASVAKDDFFVPMTRKNDRNGDPIQIGPLDWAFLHVKEVDGAKLDLD